MCIAEDHQQLSRGHDHSKPLPSDDVHLCAKENRDGPEGTLGEVWGSIREEVLGLAESSSIGHSAALKTRSEGV